MLPVSDAAADGTTLNPLHHESTAIISAGNAQAFFSPDAYLVVAGKTIEPLQGVGAAGGRASNAVSLRPAVPLPSHSRSFSLSRSPRTVSKFPGRMLVMDTWWQGAKSREVGVLVQ